MSNARSTMRQQKFIEAVMREGGMDRAEVERETQERFGCEIQHLSVAQAATLITELQARRAHKTG
jgi:hypothetical protein